MKWLTILLFFSPLFASSPDIIVTVPPTNFLVKRIAGDSLSSQVLMPPGTDPHTFELKAKDLIRLTSTKVWFHMGEGWERRATSALENKMCCIDLRKKIPPALLSAKDHHNHIWLSPKLLVIQAAEIEKVLSDTFPDKRALFEENRLKLVSELEVLDQEITSLTREAPHKTFLTVHPVFDTFCDAYGFRQIAIEKEGKEPSTKELVKLIQKAKEQKISTIVISPQYSQKVALAIAKELEIKPVNLDPFEEDVIANLTKIAKELSK